MISALFLLIISIGLGILFGIKLTSTGFLIVTVIGLIILLFCGNSDPDLPGGDLKLILAISSVFLLVFMWLTVFIYAVYNSLPHLQSLIKLLVK